MISRTDDRGCEEIKIRSRHKEYRRGGGGGGRDCSSPGGQEGPLWGHDAWRESRVRRTLPCELWIKTLWSKRNYVQMGVALVCLKDRWKVRVARTEWVRQAGGTEVRVSHMGRRLGFILRECVELEEQKPEERFLGNSSLKDEGNVVTKPGEGRLLRSKWEILQQQWIYPFYVHNTEWLLFCEEWNERIIQLHPQPTCKLKAWEMRMSCHSFLSFSSNITAFVYLVMCRSAWNRCPQKCFKIAAESTRQFSHCMLSLCRWGNASAQKLKGSSKSTQA